MLENFGGILWQFCIVHILRRFGIKTKHFSLQKKHLACYRGHFGPFVPKVAKESEVSPFECFGLPPDRNSFQTPSATFGAKVPESTL